MAAASKPTKPNRPGPVRGKSPGRAFAKRDAAPRVIRGEPGQRRSLSHVGGKVEFRGEDPTLQAVLEEALRVGSGEDEVRAHVHGFHSYPARLHPATARGLIEGLSKPGGVVLDPFCGSGTVLVEASLAGRQGIGVDANPLSVLLTQVKCTRAGNALRAALLKEADQIMAEAEERRKVKAPPHVRYAPTERQWFDTHVLLELDSLWHRLQTIADPHVRDPLALVFSSLMTKVSKKAGDSSPRSVSKRIASGYTIRHFGDRTRELVAQLQEYAELVGPKPPQCRVFEGDARRLVGVKENSADLIVSSPPYPGVFDYLGHHELRLRWLGMKRNAFARNEIGARREMAALGNDALEKWSDDFSRVLKAIRRTLKPGAAACLVMADSVVGERPVFADELVPKLSGQLGLKLAGIASQRRPYFHQATAGAFDRRPRREHVIVVRK